MDINHCFIFSMDIWDSDLNKNNDTREGVIGFSYVGGICGNNTYSIVEDMGFFNIPNAAHELGHK
jgi:hypothetical protein